MAYEAVSRIYRIRKFTVHLGARERTYADSDRPLAEPAETILRI